MKNKAIIFITAFNCEKYIEKCISSVSEQSFQDTLIILIDDSSNDGTYNVATKALTRLFPDRHKIIKNDKKIGKAGNAFLHLNGNDAIFCAILDGDDYLLDPTILQDYYEQYKLGYDVVWSNYQINDIRIGQIKGHSAALNPMQNPRSQGWKTSHFFSFRYQLFTVVPKYYFKDDNGTWLQSACDQAIALPILDQTRRYKFINKVSYFYRTDNPNNHHNKNNLGTKALQISSQQQRQNSKIVYSKTPLPLAFRLHN
ncbi:glycosyltransferase family 2 protein, partial [Paracoccaceae bacterium]|nr:glycosyltransferase family 2 protein [Paracoccaceae bacterium]